uniref:TPX2 C-terminal domain-containing protein n=1 Tax=Opuntia streptacantha TaxID=393608 RepID=A0A7C9B0P1_OPUST
MGESLVEAPKVENKMGESVPCLQESVSFGRFEHDSLCWERWSTFPTNKYLEEVEKCSTPGSVAQKKAYFEAHYKKIAARKTELLDQEKKRETELMNSEDQSQTSLGSVCNHGEEESDAEKPKAQVTATVSELENEEPEFKKKVTDAHTNESDHGANIFDEEWEIADVNGQVSLHIDEPNDGADIIYENEDLQPPCADAIEVLWPKTRNPEIGQPEETVSVEEEGISTLDSEHIEELPHGEVQEREIADKDAQDVVELDDLKKRQEGLVQDKVEENNNAKEEAKDVEGLDSSKEAQKELPLDNVEEREVARKENEDLVKSENPRKMEKGLLQDKFEKGEVAKKETKAPWKSENPKKIHKEMPVNKTTGTTNARKKPASPMAKKSLPIAKSPMLSTPKSLRPALSKIAMSTTDPSAKKENGSTPLSLRKSPMLSAPKSSKTSLSKTATSTNRAMLKKENGSSPLTIKKAARPESKRVLPTSLHMSLSLEPANCDPAVLMTTRKSLIMEKMGDKDIVKRAFKAFQNFSPSSLIKASPTDQFGDKKIGKGSVLVFPQKKEGITRAVKPSNPTPGQLGTRKTGVYPGLYKTGDVDRRNGTSLPASLRLRSQDLGHKQKEVSRNSEQKPRAKEAVGTYLDGKVKLEKPAPARTPSWESSNTRLSSSYNLGQGFFKGLRKDVTKSQASG